MWTVTSSEFPMKVGPPHSHRKDRSKEGFAVSWQKTSFIGRSISTPLWPTPQVLSPLLHWSPGELVCKLGVWLLQACTGREGKWILQWRISIDNDPQFSPHPREKSKWGQLTGLHLLPFPMHGLYLGAEILLFSDSVRWLLWFREVTGRVAPYPGAASTDNTTQPPTACMFLISSEGPSLSRPIEDF